MWKFNLPGKTGKAGRNLTVKTDESGIEWTSNSIPITQNTLTKEPTGFSAPGSVIVDGDAGSRIVTLTGTTTAYYQGVLVPAIVSGWTSPAHDDTAGSNFFLAYDGSNYTWTENGFPGFDKLLIAYALWDGSNTTWVYQRECHGLMQHQVHKEFHETVGTYKSAGGTIPSASYTLGSTTAANRRPNIDETTIYDEDLPSVNAAVTSKLYTKMTLGNASVSQFTVETADIVPLSGNNPYYNTFSSPNRSQTLMPANSVATVWVYAMPVCAGTSCQKYRYFFVQPQWVTQAAGPSAGQLLTALNAEKLRLPSELNLGSLALAALEFVAIGRIAITYTGGNWVLSDVTLLTGNKYSQIGSPSGNFLSTVSTDTTLVGNGTVASPLGVNTQSITLMGLRLTGAKYVSAYGEGLATGDRDLYTVPTGKKAYVLNIRTFNPTLNTITYYSQLKISGTYYRIGNTTSLATVTAQTTGGPTAGIVLNAGESISLNISGNSGLNAGFKIYEFDDTVPIKRYSILGLVSGNNTLYTVPVGKTANVFGNLELGSVASTITIRNSSANTQTYTGYLVPNGSSVASTNQINATSSTITMTSTSPAIPGTLSTGDAIVINTASSDAGQNAWVNVVEI